MLKFSKLFFIRSRKFNIVLYRGYWTKGEISFSGLRYVLLVKVEGCLAAYECILTNFLRSKCGVEISPICTQCGREVETTLCVQCDCDYITQVMLHFVHYDFIIDLFLMIACNCFSSILISWGKEIWYKLTCNFHGHLLGIWTWRTQLFF